MEEEKQQSNVDTLGGEAAGVALAVALEYPMAFDPPEMVAELVESVLAFGQAEGGQHSPVNLAGRLAGQQAAVVKQDLEQSNQTGVVQFQPRVMHGADPDRQRDPLQQRKVDVDVEPLRLLGGETFGNGLESFADRVQVIEAPSLARSRTGCWSRSRCARTGRTSRTA